MSDTLELSAAKRRLLEKLRRGAVGGSDNGTEPVTPRAPDTTAPLSPDQRQVWLHSAMAPELPLYNEPITIHRRGSFDRAALERSFNEILRRHEIWRTAFDIAPDGSVIQRVQADLRVALPLVDLTGLPAATREATALRLATEEARRPFDLAQPPLFRPTLLKLAEDDHRLHLTLHHIIFDGVSIYRIFLPELAALYAAEVGGQASPLAEPRLHYGDYAAWRKARSERPPVARQLDYWRRQLAGELPVLQLPTDHPRPPTLTYRGSMETFSLPRALTDKLRTLSQREGATLYMTLLAAFKALLHRYSGQEDILIGGVTDTRRRRELEGLMGYFLNSLVLRSRPGPEQSFRAFLGQVRKTVLEALDHSELPFDRLVQALHPKRDPSRHPLFQVLFSVEPPAGEFAEGWDLTQMDVTIGAAKFDLYLELDERPEGMIGRFLYSSDLFEAPTIRRMIGHWLMLLHGVAADPDCRLDRLPLLSATEQQEMTARWNATAQSFPALTLHALIEAQVRRTPRAVAVECGGDAWRYETLERRAAALAQRLRRAGIVRGTLVAIAVERSLDMMAGLLAILKAGAAYLPLDPGFPPQRLSLILADAEPAVLLTQRRLLPQFPQPECPILFLEEEAPEEKEAASVGDEAGPDDPAYVLYTSGSTGKPKGVEVPHRAVVNLLTSMQREPGFTAADTLLAVTTLSFDIAALELFLPLITGGRVVIASRAAASDPMLLAPLIQASGATVMQATPATWRALIDSGWEGNARLKTLCGGEALPRELAERLLSHCASLWNMYGPTETTIWSVIHPVTRGRGLVPIGRPIANTTAHILDARGNRVPVGVPGELYLGGAGVARGYRGQPALTRERFVAAAAAAGERLYRTGDLAVFRADGTIECRGRNDNQVKIRGFRIELEEVETALAAHTDVGAAAVRSWPEAGGGLRLVGYIAGRNGRSPDAATLRRFLQARLPDYMVPSEFVALEALTLTPNGKLDRNALPPPAAAGAAPSAPLSSEEDRILARIWAELLGRPAVGGAENFFDLGGHSLLVARLQRRIEIAFGQRVPMAALFNAPTVAGQAELLRNGAGSGRLIPIQRTGTRPPLFWIDAPPRLPSLSSALGPEQPLFGTTLAASDLEALGDAPEMQEIAALHVRAIREVQATGPYALAGLCTGGIVAYEVAVQLQAAGHDVASLILVDSRNPVFFRRRIGPLAVEWSKLCFYIPRILRLSPALAAADQVVPRVVRRMWRRDWLSHQQSRIEEITDAAAYRYQPPRYSGTVQLLQATERPKLLDLRPGWTAVVAGELRTIEVPGHHDYLFLPGNIDGLAAAVVAALAGGSRAQPAAAQ